MRGAGYQPNKQTNKQTDSEAQKLVNILAERSQIGTQADLHIHRSKQKWGLMFCCY